MQENKLHGQRVRVATEATTYLVEAEAVRIGEDVLVYIFGGQKPHIGAVAASQPRPSLTGSNDISATSSVLTYLGHKEDGVVKYAADTLAAALKTKVVVTAGIHWDDLSNSEIKTIFYRCQEIVEKLRVQLINQNDELS